ncbi:hypothetical protein [Nonomuraea zeae]|uniref:Uncharacterized protein n=1 Tax=Nonomuraea zeae TaxID=1642303 RepID=A0A5S4G7D1_9ACTN|nr:hypothetical protein [Nonomuraea zeae]TMR28749.1 hypothetical protein ETD85_34725 [Nonomuraea zeae]
MGRAALTCAALGVLWWATVRLAWTGVGCEDWGCLVPAVGIVVVVTVVLFAGAAYALERVSVRPGRRVALAAAGVLVVFRLVGEALPSWTSEFAHAVMAAVTFAGAGGLAAFLTEPGVARRWKTVTTLALVGLLPLAFFVSWARFGA